jgi:uncharacterized protein
MLYAAIYGYGEVVELLIKGGVDLSATDEDGRTALHYAAMLGYEPIVELLTKGSADLSVRDSDGRTNLH